MLEEVQCLSELDLARSGLATHASLAVLLHFLRSESCALTALDLSGNPLHAVSNFPDLFATLASRKSRLLWLSLADCGLAKGDADTLAEFLRSDPHLEHLDVSGSLFGASLARFGPALIKNYHLRTLALRSCGVSLSQCQALFLSMLPACLGLSVEGLPLSWTPSLAPSTLMTRSLNDIAPSALDRYSKLVLVDAPDLALSHPSISSIPFLEALLMQRCPGLGKCPLPPLAPLRNLASLSLHACGIRDLSELLSQPHLFPALLSLSLCSNRLRSLPGQIGLFPRLVSLNLRCNMLQDLPIQLSSLSSLQYLNVSANPLGGLPSFVSALSPLRTPAHLAELFNYLTCLSGQGALPSPFLRLVLFSESPADTARFLAETRPVGKKNTGSTRGTTVVAKRGAMRFAPGTSPSNVNNSNSNNIGSTNTSTQPLSRASVAVLSRVSATPLSRASNASPVSASPPSSSSSSSSSQIMSSSPPSSSSSSSSNCVFRRLAGGTSGSNSDISLPADGSIYVDSCSYPEGVLLESTRIDIRIWHSSRAMHVPHLLACGSQAAYVWVFDAAKYEEDSSLVRKEIITWSKMVELVAGKRVPMFVAAASHDESFAASLAELEAGLRSALPHPAPQFLLLPHKSGNSGFALRSLATQAQKRGVVGLTVQGSWVSCADALSTIVEELRVQTMREFATYAQGYGVEGPQVKNLLRYLHAIGVVWWFDAPQLEDWVFVNPPLVIGVCTKLLEALRLGVDSESVLSGPVDKLWARELSLPFHAPFLKLLVRLDMIFEMNGGRFFIPSTLPTQDIASVQPQQPLSPRAMSASSMVAREYHFMYIPTHFFHRFCVKVFWFTDVAVKTMWKHGVDVILRKGDKVERGRVIWDAARFVLNITVESSHHSPPGGFHMHKGQLLRFLVDTAETLARGEFKAKFAVKIPCNHCLMDPSTRAAPYHFSYQEVVDALTSNSRSLPCQGLKSRQVLISSLCPDLAMADISRNQIPSDEVEMGELLGQGGFASVYRAVWKGQSVAVKQMHACHSEEEFGEFQREAWIMGGLRSPYLVQLLGVCLEPPKLVMELLQGGSLYSYLRSRNGEAIDPQFRLQIAFDIAMGMSVLESSAPPLIHRDLKSPNILMVATEPGGAVPCAKVTDFGLSKQLFGNLAGRDVFNPDWLAPEIILDQPYTMSSDVFSFGIILWELVSLQHPFDEYSTRFAGMPDVVKEEAIAKDHLRPTIPPSCEPWYAKLIAECWDSVPTNRPSFESIVETLLDNPSRLQPQLEHDMSSEATSPRPSSSPLPPSVSALSLSSSSGAVPLSSSLSSLDSERQRRATLLRGHRMSALGRKPVAPLQRDDSVDLRTLFRAPLSDDARSVRGQACRVARRAVLSSPPTALAVTRGELFWAGLLDGSLACLSGRTCSVLNVLPLRRQVPVTCIGRAAGKIFVGFSDGWIASVSLSSVLLDSLDSRPVRSAVRALASSAVSSAPVLALFADGSLLLLRADLSLPSSSSLLRLSGVSAASALCVMDDAEPLAFVGDSTGQVWVVALPDLAVRGSFCASATRAGVTSLAMVQGVLWVGLATGHLAMFRIGGGVSALASRSAHQSPVAAIVSFEHTNCVCSVSRNGHLCWWSMEDFDLEWEKTSLFEPSSSVAGRSSEDLVCAAVNLEDRTLVVCEPQKLALTFVRLVADTPLPAEALKSVDLQAAAATFARRAQNGQEEEVDRLLEQSDAETQVYVLVQMYRQAAQDEEKRTVAKTIQTRFFSRLPCPVDLPRAQYVALKEQLASCLAKTGEEMPPLLFDGLANTIFSRKRSSIVDLTKTVFMDLCAKGIELRALTYDESLLVSFNSLCDNYDVAAWEDYQIKAKSRSDGKKISMTCWKLRDAAVEQGSFTGKVKIKINVPEHVVLALVSRPEHKVRWEKTLASSEMVKEFSKDFFVVHSIYETPGLMVDRDAVIAYLTTRHNGNIVCVARSVPYGNVPVPLNHLRLVVDISGFQIQRLSDASCQVTMLTQLREMRKTNILSWSVARRKRMVSLFRLKEYAESMDAEQLSSFPFYDDVVAPPSSSKRGTGTITPPPTIVVASATASVNSFSVAVPTITVPSQVSPRVEMGSARSPRSKAEGTPVIGRRNKQNQ